MTINHESIKMPEDLEDFDNIEIFHADNTVSAFVQIAT